MTSGGRVVVGSGWKLKVASVAAAAMAVGLWPGVVASVNGGLGGEDVPVAAEVVGTVLVWVFAILCTGAVWGIWWFRQTFSADEVTVRVLGPTSRIRLATATSLSLAVSAPQRTVRATAVRHRRLVVEGPSERGPMARAGIDATMGREVEAQAVLLDWARRRPELVADDETRAYLEEIARRAGAA